MENFLGKKTTRTSDVNNIFTNIAKTAIKKEIFKKFPKKNMEYYLSSNKSKAINMTIIEAIKVISFFISRHTKKAFFLCYFFALLLIHTLFLCLNFSKLFIMVRITYTFLNA